MQIESLIATEHGRLTRRLAVTLGGDVHAAEDLAQEAFARAWQRLPRELEHEQQRAWLRRTAGNLALDELRRRARRPAVSLDDTMRSAAGTSGQAPAPHQLASYEDAEPDAAREALESLSAHERFVLLLRFDAGFAHAEIARLLDVSEEAARKRVARARSSFLSAYRAMRAEAQPLVLLLARDDEPLGPYVAWLEHAGARVRQLSSEPSERELALAGGLVLTGSGRDVHSSLYGESPRALRGDPKLEEDRQDLTVVRAALTLDLPMIGICRGHQLLNIASGGSLYQDIVEDGATGGGHELGNHRLDTHDDTRCRHLLGVRPRVSSCHHQAVRRLGRRLRVTASTADGLVEMIERDDRRFAVGLQWHPEDASSAPGALVAEALVAAASQTAA